MSRPHSEAPSHFPHWVALGSLAFVLWLFFGNTVPALRERAELRNHAEALAQLKASYDAAIQEARLGVGPNAHYDLQALLVAIDQRGYTPLELCVAYPETRASGTGSGTGTGSGAHDAPARTERAAR
jgi:hypothetical protein